MEPEAAKAFHTLQKRQFKVDLDNANNADSLNSGNDAFHLFDFFRGKVNVRKRKQHLFGSEWLGSWVSSVAPLYHITF